MAPSGASGYAITFTADAQGNPAPLDPLGGTPISAGPYQGFKGIITPYDITVTARSTGGAEVRMRRTLQTIAVPVFQFGVFSENDLSFFAGPNFNFGGRVHTNANLYLAEGNANALTLSDRVTTVGEIVRTNLSNGFDTTVSYTGTVNVLQSTPTCTTSPGTGENRRQPGGHHRLRPERADVDDVVGRHVHNSNIRNGRTGARRLDLPLVSQGAVPIDLVRRPAQNSNENVVPRSSTRSDSTRRRRFAFCCRTRRRILRSFRR